MLYLKIVTVSVDYKNGKFVIICYILCANVEKVVAIQTSFFAGELT